MTHRPAFYSCVALLVTLVTSTVCAATAPATNAKPDLVELDPTAEAQAEAAFNAQNANGDPAPAYDTSDEITVADMLPAVVGSEELVDDDNGANEAAEAFSLTPTQEEADAIADAYLQESLGERDNGAAVSLPQEAATLADEPARDADAAPGEDSSRLHQALPFARTAPVDPAARARLGQKM